MPGCWVREDHAWEWRHGDAPAAEVEMSDNPVLGVLLGPDGEVVSALLAREPIGYKPERWSRG